MGSRRRLLAFFAVVAVIGGACTASEPQKGGGPAGGSGSVQGQPGGGGVALDAAIQDLSQRLISPQQPTSFSFTNRELAVVASREVDSIDTGTGACANANPDGSFDITLPSRLGSAAIAGGRTT